MFDTLKTLSVMEEETALSREELGTLPCFDAPPVHMEQLPQGLIEDQV